VPDEFVAVISFTDPASGVALADETTVAAFVTDTFTEFCEVPRALAGIFNVMSLLDICPPEESVIALTSGVGTRASALRGKRYIFPTITRRRCDARRL